jgi:hypothetical protein
VNLTVVLLDMEKVVTRINRKLVVVVNDDSIGVVGLERILIVEPFPRPSIVEVEHEEFQIQYEMSS